MDKYYEELLSAIQDNNIPRVKRLVETRRISRVPLRGYSLLAKACERNLTEIVKYLLSKDCDVCRTERCIKHRTPLYYAIISGNIKIIKMLLRRGARVNIRDEDESTLLFNAIENADYTISELLLHYGFHKHDFLASCTPLHLAALWGKIEIIEKCLVKGAAVDAKTRNGMTPIHFATYRGHVSIVERLINQGASVNELAFCGLKVNSIVDFSHSYLYNTCSPLHIAVANEHVSLVKLLLDHGANVNAEYREGQTALSFASENSYVITKLLLSYCPDVKVIGNENALANAIFNKSDLSTVRCLFEYGFSINPKYVKNKPFLKAVCELGCVEAMENLIRYGLDVNTAINNFSQGESLLHLVVKNKKLDLCDFLLKCKANVNMKDDKNKSPFFYSVKNCDVEIGKLLLDYVPNQAEHIMQTLNIAIEDRALEIVEFILENYENINVNLVDNHGRTSLHYTVLCAGDVYLRPYVNSVSDDLVRAKIARLLLIKGAQVDSSFDSPIGELTTLIVAAFNGCKNVIEVLLEHDAGVNFETSSGVSPLLAAVTHGRKEIIECLIGSVSAHFVKNYRALHCATEKRYTDIVELLLKYGSNCNLRGKGGSTVLHLAVLSRNRKVIEMVLKSGCDIALKDNCGDTALHIACKNGFDKNFHFLLQYFLDVQDPSTQTFVDLLDMKGNWGLAPLVFASKNGVHDIVKALLKFKLNVNSQDCYGRTALHHAVLGDFSDIVELLLEKRIDWNLQDSNHSSAVHLAVERGNQKVTKMLLKAGCDYKLQDLAGRTILHLAVINGRNKIFHVILKYILSLDDYTDETFVEFLDLKDSQGLNCLILACNHGYDDIVETLLSLGSNINSQDCDGATALHNAVEKDIVGIVELLLKYGIDCNLLDKCNRTALHLAVCKGNRFVIEMLLRGGCDYRLQDLSGRTILHIAVEKGQAKILHIILTCIRTLSDHSYQSFVEFLDLKDRNGLTSLTLASRNGFDDIVKILLNSGSNVNSTDFIGRNSLHLAVEMDFIRVVALLLKYRINCCSKDKYSRTALDLAVLSRSSKTMIKMLVEAGCDYKLRNEKGRSVLHLASQYRNVLFVRVLLDCILSVNDQYDLPFMDFLNMKDEEGLTPLMVASINGSQGIVEILLNSGANVNAQDLEGKTALHHAVLRRHRYVIRMLLKFGSDINCTTTDGSTPLSCCEFDYSVIRVGRSFQRINRGTPVITLLKNHVIKLMAIGLYVCQENVRHVNRCIQGDRSIPLRSKVDIISLEDCLTELIILKNCILYRSITFFDIITASVDRFGKYLRNEEFMKSLNSCEYVNRFPIYADVIFSRIKMAERRNHLKDQCIMQLQCGNTTFSRLPYFCCEDILSYLSEDDLRVFITANGIFVK